jgi:DNA-directed RNA polymerase subunit RPC12/RpoP
VSPMADTVHLGYACANCRTLVPVYTFARSNGCKTVATPPEDQSVKCPNCHSPRTVKFAELQYLDRWEEAAQTHPQSTRQSRSLADRSQTHCPKSLAAA